MPRCSVIGPFVVAFVALFEAAAVVALSVVAERFVLSKLRDLPVNVEKHDNEHEEQDVEHHGRECAVVDTGAKHH